MKVAQLFYITIYKLRNYFFLHIYKIREQRVLFFATYIGTNQ